MSEEKEANFHQFWGTQPVPHEGNQKVRLVGPLDTPKSVDDVQKEPYPLASILEWWTPDLSSDEDLTSIYDLLKDNYVEDTDSMFRFNYSKEFLRWALAPPGYIHDWHVGVRKKDSKKLLAFISGIPMTMRMGTPKSLITKENEGEEHYQEPREICEINFLCVHKVLRDKRMAPILIKEVTRRVNLRNIWQAVYTAGKVLPTPFASARYQHRSLNPEKLIAIRFSSMPGRYSKFQNPMVMLKKAYQVPDVPKTKNLRVMTAADVPQVTTLLNKELGRYDVAPVFSEERAAQALIPLDGVVFTYVVTDDDGKVTDFFSFYSLPSTVIGNSKYSQLNAAYVHYYVANTVSVRQLLGDLLVEAQSKGFDVVNLVDILQNGKVVADLKFSMGDGSLHYYFYNWAYPHTEPGRIGLVML